MGDDLRQLIGRCLRGDHAAMVELIDRYYGQVFGLCYRMLGQREDAEDMAQETFVRVLRNLSRWDPTRDFEPWLLAIAGNRCRTSLSIRRRKPAMQPLVEPLADDALDRQAEQHLVEEVNLALGGLRAEYRQAFVLFHQHQLSYVEIAETMGCPLGTVRTWIHRARRELIQRLTDREVVQESRHAMRRV